MKKFLTMAAAGAVAFSLAATSFAADTGMASARVCATLMGAEKTKCLREQQALKLQQWKAGKIGKLQLKVDKRMEKIDMHAGKAMQRITRRSLLREVRATEMLNKHRRSSSSSMMSSSSISSAMSSSSMSSSSAMSSSMSSVSSH